MKQNLYLFQPQYATPFDNKISYWIPYSIGCLWSYLQQFESITDNWNLKELGYKRENHQNILGRLENPKVCGFSCYVWNEQYCLNLSKSIKEKYPDCLIVFGGPQTNQSYIEYEFIDCLIYGEGEINFKTILESIISKTDIKKIWHKDRLEDINYPSPYTSGIFDDIIKNNPDVEWNVTLETNRGCPYSCTFCDWGSAIYTKVRRFDFERVQKEIEWTATNNCSYIFLADANFGIFKDRDLAIAKLLKKSIDHPQSKLTGINIQFAKNSNEVVFEVGKILGDILKGITFSVQSMNADTLEAIKRKNMKINEFSKLLELGHKYDTPTYTEMILGMPLETLETWKSGLTELLELGQHQSIDVWFTQLLPNSEMSSLESRKKYGITQIRAQNYIEIYNNKDENIEYIDLINSTNNMSTKEMVEAYVYGWVITQFHISGYTQVLAKYMRNVCGMSYREFYDKFFEEIQKDNTFKHVYNKLTRIVDYYLHSGKIVDDEPTLRGHNLHYYGNKIIYDNKSRIIGLVKNFAGSIHDDIIKIQENFIIDQYQSEKTFVKSNFDIDSWQIKKTNYTIQQRTQFNENFDFWINRQRGLLKNKIIKELG
jgi:putative methyltransferase